MGTLTNEGKNIAAEGVGEVALYAALHDDDPGADGSQNEISGGTPAYARKAITWESEATNGQLQASSQPEFDVPSGVTVKYASFWTAVSGGTCLGIDPVDEEAFTNQGKYTLTSASLQISDAA